MYTTVFTMAELQGFVSSESSMWWEIIPGPPEPRGAEVGLTTG